MPATSPRSRRRSGSSTASSSAGPSCRHRRWTMPDVGVGDRRSGGLAVLFFSFGLGLTTPIGEYTVLGLSPLYLAALASGVAGYMSLSSPRRIDRAYPVVA